MPLTCSRCSRLNPAEALFCFHDGAALGDPARRRQASDPARLRFPMPFVFPSGKKCHTFDELALGIQANWDEARTLLKHGVFTSFLSGLGRADLSVAARDAEREADSDTGVDNLLQRLPAGVLEPARLSVEPGQVNLGTLRAGQDVRFDLHLSNRGMGLLSGSITCEDAAWLLLGDPTTRSRRKLFQILHDTTIPIHIRGQALTASSRPLVAHLLVESNGGTVQVPVTLEVPVVPFPDGVLAGAVTPRQVAQKARESPKEAAEQFARGAVAKWYALNGWVYPVLEPSVSGIAAVQQFFEALGLTTPPKVSVSVPELLLEGRGGDSVRASFLVVAQEKKPVIAHVTSDQPWLQVLDVHLDGRTATVQVRVDEVPDEAGRRLTAKLTVTANGRQRFIIPVRLTVTGPAPVSYSTRSAVVTTLPEVPSRPRSGVIEDVLPVVERLEEVPAPRRDDAAEDDPVEQPTSRRLLYAALPVMFILLGLFVTMVRDLARWAQSPAVAASPGSPDLAAMPQEIALHFHDKEEPVELGEGGVKPVNGRMVPDTRPAFWEPSMRFGIDLIGRGKRLTFDPQGRTNNAVLRIDGREWLFGDRPFRDPEGRYLGNWPGRWLEMNTPAQKTMRDGRRSVWGYDGQNIRVTQTVGLVPGGQSNKIDTCLIHYRMENLDGQPHRVGIRFLLDTYIGGNDGVPFLIPGSPQLCNTSLQLVGPQVPDFIQARETEDLANPGTIALIQLRVPGMEPPARVTLGAWPNLELGGPCKQEKTLWEVPVRSIKHLTPADSAVTIYWAEQELPAGGSREVAFAYGLGQVTSGETGGELGLSVAGAFVPGGTFTLTAEVRNPTPGQTLTVELPEGFSLASGGPTAPVPPASMASAISPVAWKVRAGPREGRFTLKVKSSNGLSQSQPVDIKVRGIFGN